MSSSELAAGSRAFKMELATTGDPTPVAPPELFVDLCDSSPTMRTTSADELPHIPDVELSHVLGSGGMGTVYVGRSIDLDRPVAVKVIHPELAQHESFARRFEREARALARLSHPNIVSCYHVGRTAEGARYLLMELVDGRDLLAHVREHGVLGEHEALSVIRQLSEALAYAQGRGVIHRDVKPENILVAVTTPEGAVGPTIHAKLVDLGLAATAVGATLDLRITHTGEIMGSPLTLAPEQAETPEAVDHRADIFALGATLFFALTGHFPHEGATFGQILAKKLRDDTPHPRSLREDLHSDVAQLILWMLRASPDRRPQTYAELMEALARADAARRHPEIAPRVRSRMWLGVGAAGVVCAVGLGGAWRSLTTAPQPSLVAASPCVTEPRSPAPLPEPEPVRTTPAPTPSEESPSPPSSEPPEKTWRAPEALFGSNDTLFAKWRSGPKASLWQPADEQGSCDGVAEGSAELALLELLETPSLPCRLRVGIFPRSAKETGIRVALADESALDVAIQPISDAIVLLRISRVEGTRRTPIGLLTLADRSGARRELTVVLTTEALWARVDGSPDASGRTWACAAIPGGGIL